MDFIKSFFDAFKLITDRHKDDRTKVVAYLDDLQHTVDRLIAAWDDAFEKCTAASQGKLPRHELPGLVNVGFMTEIETRYRSTTPALAGRVDDEFRQSLLRSLAQLQITRHITKERYEIALSGLALTYFSVDQKADMNNLRLLEIALGKMKTEAAKLRVEISNYKVAL